MNGQKRGGRTKRGGSSRHMGRKKMRGRSRAEEEQKKVMQATKDPFFRGHGILHFLQLFPRWGRHITSYV